MNIQELVGLDVTLLKFQTTYLLIQAPQKQIKVNLIGKEEFHLSKQTSGNFQVLDNSPLLLDYNEPMAEMYINSKPQDPDLLMFKIKSIIETITEGRRNWLRYITIKNINFGLENFQKNVRSGSGFLLNAPLSIARGIELMCSEIGVKTKSFISTLEIVPKKILTIGPNYVIAKEFRISA